MTLDDAIRTRDDLARALRQLRRRAARRQGRPEQTYRQIAAQTGWSLALVGSYLTGKVLPPTDRFDTLVILLGATAEEQRALATARDRVADTGRSARASASSPRPPTVPHQLPRDVYGFVGREDLLAELDALALAGDEPVRLATVSGTAGVGKTALAVHWAHRVARHFPDGQLFVNMRGFDPGAFPLRPEEAVRGILAAFEVPTHRIPADPAEQAALYRTVLAGKRVLVVVDNVRVAAQVRPLLPGSPSFLLATSRHRLTGLIATEGARPFELDLLSDAQARELLALRLGEARVASEPDAAAKIITSCARLPLALTVAAAHVLTRPDRPLAALAGELAEPGRRLDVLAVTDEIADVRNVLSWSYRALDPNTARLFRLLGLHPGPDLSAVTAASLAAGPVPDVERTLDALTAAHLLSEPTPGRYAMHDLLRGYAIELVREHDGEAEQRAAVRRMLNSLLRTAQAATRLLSPVRDIGAAAELPPGVAVQRLHDEQEALAWFMSELPVLTNSVELAANTVLDDLACHLGWVVCHLCYRNGRWTAWAACAQTAMRSAQRLGDQRWQALIRRELAGAYTCLGRYEESQTEFQQTLDTFEALGDKTGMARTHRSMCLLFERQGRYQEALQHALSSRDLLLQTDDRAGRAYAFNSVGWYHALVGDFQAALENCQEAIALLRAAGDRSGEATSWDSLGFAHHHLGQYPQAITCYQRALTILRELGNPHLAADTLHHLGNSYRAIGDVNAARATWQQALAIFEEQDRPEAAEISRALHEIGHR